MPEKTNLKERIIESVKLLEGCTQEQEIAIIAHINNLAEAYRDIFDRDLFALNYRNAELVKKLLQERRQK